MEHEAIQLIRRKVRDVESQPVSWNRDRVWHMISVKAEPKSRSPFIYYAAASLLMAISLLYYMNPSHQQKQAEVSVSSSKSTVAKKPAEQPQIKHIEATGNKTNITKHIQRSTPSLPATLPPTPAVANEIQVPKITNDPMVVVLTENKEVVSPSESNEIVAEQPPVQAVIGFIPKQSSPVAVRKVKRTKFHLFRSAEKEGGTFADEESRLLSARIN